MPLADLWAVTPELHEKRIAQLIALAGSGQLRDEQVASHEFREFLASVPSPFLDRYIDECLHSTFEGSGFALQDIVNELGRRLDFDVQFGRYRGTTKHVGFDGLWRSESGHAIVVEVKTTDAYSISLDTISSYRRTLIKQADILEDTSSILIVVGRADTGGLEAQVRGSRHAWDIRLISVDALLRLIHLKESVEDPLIGKKISSILTPQEYTKVDGIVEIVFLTAKDIEQESSTPKEVDEQSPTEQNTESGTNSAPSNPSPDESPPAAFHNDCVDRIKIYLGQTLIRRSRTKFISPNGSLEVICAVSRAYGAKGSEGYWYAFHAYSSESLTSAHTAYVAFGCGSDKIVLLIPFQGFSEWLDGMDISQRSRGSYWHVRIYRDKDRIILRQKGPQVAPQ